MVTRIATRVWSAPDRTVAIVCGVLAVTRVALRFL